MKHKNPYQITTLPNGLSVALRPMEHVASVAVGVWVRAGGRYEPLPLSGISHFVEHLVFKGTRRRSCEQLKQAIEGVGGSLNGFTAEEFTCYMVKVPARYARRAVEILSDMMLRSSFAADDVEKEREVILEEIRMYEDAPGQYVHDLFNQLLWPNHPLGSLLSGTVATVRKMTRRDVMSYWRSRYHHRNLLVSCAGAFHSEELLRGLRASFGTPRRGSVRPFLRAPRIRRGPQVQVMGKTTEQAHLCLGGPAIARMHPLRFAVELLHVLLGANMSSRLFREVRERRGLAYEIGTHIKRFKDTGAFVISAGCDPGKLVTTVKVIANELAKVRAQRVGVGELKRAKEFYRGQLTMALEETLEHMLWMGEQVVTVGRVGELKHLLSAIDRVSVQDIRQAARALFEAKRLFLAIIGPTSDDQTQALRRSLEMVR
ncbi:MAG: insulinase family protein [Candidatus Omnitrophica bacterium]|nr:insulinase family protein [Candidatus Omnitrophota bacterium]